MKQLQFLAIVGIALLLGWNAVAQNRPQDRPDAQGRRQSPWRGLQHAAAVMVPTDGNKTHGVITFTQSEGKVKVEAHIGGLEPNAQHAIHIHEFGDLRKADGTGTGGHYNPEMHDHGLPEKEMRHAGDMGNLSANAEGVANYSIELENVTIAGRRNPIIGRGVIIHAKKDDGGQPTGNAGARISQGVIGIVKAPE